MVRILSLIILSLLVIVGVFIGCSDQMTPTGVDQTIKNESNQGISLSKVNISTIQTTVDASGFLDCNPNLEMFGKVEVFETYKDLPNGNVVFDWYTDYYYWPPMEILDHSTGDWYVFVKGNNPIHGTASAVMDNGQWSFTEFYKTADGKKLFLHQNGTWHWINGKVDFEVFNDFCR